MSNDWRIGFARAAVLLFVAGGGLIVGHPLDAVTMFLTITALAAGDLLEIVTRVRPTTND